MRTIQLRYGDILFLAKIEFC